MNRNFVETGERLGRHGRALEVFLVAPPATRQMILCQIVLPQSKHYRQWDEVFNEALILEED